MRKIKILFALLFIVCISVNAQSKKQELKLKKAISTFTKKVKKIKDRDKKEKVITAFVSKLKKEYDNNIDKINEEEQGAFTDVLNKLDNGLELVKDGSHDSLNDYVDYLESEFNQAAVDWVLIGGIILALYLIGFLFPNLFLM